MPHDPYKNPSGTDVNPAGIARWTMERLRQRLPRPPVEALLPVAPDIAYLHHNRTEPSVTWIGHASLLVQIGGCNVLIDPVFSRRVSPVRFAGPKRHQAPGLTVAQLPPIDVVLISHNHYDHLDRPSVRAVAQQGFRPMV
jgi:N-acyl-phosphatidylethanolamine-hydrolysing phospholipase D